MAVVTSVHGSMADVSLTELFQALMYFGHADVTPLTIRIKKCQPIVGDCTNEEGQRLSVASN